MSNPSFVGKDSKGKFKPMLSETFIERSVEKHGKNYDYSNTVFKNSKTKVSINCPIHGNFLILPHSHLQGVGCKQCYKSSLVKTTKQFIDKAKKFHGNSYDYSETTYVDAKSKLKIICPQHGIFFQKANNHLSGNGCKECGKSRRGKIFRLSKNDFISKAIEIFDDIYDYEISEYTTTSEKIKIKCKEHNIIFEQTAGNHLSGRYGCPRCKKWKSQDAWLDSFNLPNDSLHRQVKLCIGGKNFIVDGYNPLTNTIYEYWGTFFHGHPDYYDADDINTVSKKKFGDLYQETLEKIKVINDNGYNLVQQWAHHYSGKYEVLVNPPGKTYKIELMTFLNENKIEFKRGKYDFIISDYNIAIEFADLKWNSSEFVDNNYHYEKWKQSIDDGVKLFLIFEDEWLNNCNAIKLKILHACGKGIRGLGARKHNICKISTKEAKNFTEKHHIQGAPGSCVLAYGSFINGSYIDGDLVSVMIFNKQRITNNIELVRFCTDGNSYAGIFSKLFKVAMDENPEINQVISFADRRYSDGNLYEKSVFSKDSTTPADYRYIVGNKTYHKSNYTKKNISKKFGLDMSRITERNAMEQLGYSRIYDCGKIKYIWTRPT